MRQRARRVDDFHQSFKWQLLVAVGRQVAGTHPRHEVDEARIARRVGAQHQGVDEEPHQVVERMIAAPRHRAADRDVVTGAQPGEQRRKTGLQHHEQARAVLPRQRQQLLVQIGRQPQRHPAAPVARHPGPRTVRGQRDRLRQVRKRLRPEPKLARNGALRIALRAQHLVLPERVVGILHRQRRQRAPAGRHRPGHTRRIGVGEIARQRCQR